MRRTLIVGFGLVVTACWLIPTTTSAADRPNVLFLSIDDLNDWTGFLGGHPQA